MSATHPDSSPLATPSRASRPSPLARQRRALARALKTYALDNSDRGLALSALEIETWTDHEPLFAAVVCSDAAAQLAEHITTQIHDLSDNYPQHARLVALQAGALCELCEMLSMAARTILLAAEAAESEAA